MKTIEILETNTKICDGINTLLPQLSEMAPKLTTDDIQNIIDAEGSTLIVATDRGAVVGCVTISVFPVLTDVRAWIDDLVVHVSARGRGVGRQLVDHAMNKAAAMGARSVNLTCNPRRTSANALYGKMGFRGRETHVYNLRFDRP